MRRAWPALLLVFAFGDRVAVLGGRPTGVKSIVDVPCPRRDGDNSAARAEILAALGSKQ